MKQYLTNNIEVIHPGSSTVSKWQSHGCFPFSDTNIVLSFLAFNK